MLKRRVCICLLINDGVLFRTKKFVPDYRYTANFVGADAVDEVFLIDITRSGPSEASHKTMAAYAERCFSPVTMGGHIKSLDDVKKFMAIGADKVVVGDYFFEEPAFINRIAQKYGSQAVTVGFDMAGGSVCIDRATGTYMGNKIMWSRRAEAEGAGEIFLQSVERDGSLSGYDLDTLKSVVAAVNIPVVVGTSCGSALHMREAFEAGAAGCATANIHHLTDAAIRGFKQQLTAAGVEVRA